MPSVAKGSVMKDVDGSRQRDASQWGGSQSWHIITSEYPPQSGGVSDYTRGVAAGLASRGDEVHVWCAGQVPAEAEAAGVTVHRELGKISPADLDRVGRQLDGFPGPRRILVQWVPHGYGYRSMNVAFCWWLRNRAVRCGDRVEIMVHEPYLSFGKGSPRQSAVAAVHRLMTMILLRAAERVWTSIPHWEGTWRPYALGRRIPFQWLPIPSNIPVAHDPGRVRDVRRRYAPDGRILLGHFGTFGWPITSVLEPILIAQAGQPVRQAILLMGIGSKEYRDALIRKNPQLTPMIEATGPLTAEELSCHVAACDLLIQPYPDGVSSRRTSVMIGLCHGKPIISNMGPLSEPFWPETRALALASLDHPDSYLGLLEQLTTDAGERARMAAAARDLYQQRFDIAHIIEALRKPECQSDRQSDRVCAS
jgi:glycosyltransferase involved in cell wall biosynthesis